MQPPIDDYQAQVCLILQELGITEEIPAARGLVLWRSPTKLVTAGFTSNGKEFLLTPEAAEAWHKLKTAAAGDDILLQMVSAYRSIEHQALIIRRKLEQGMILDEILKVLAPPGYSEHHSGSAMDIGSPDCLPLDEQFEAMPAYNWLSMHANRFRFFLSFPRNNKFGYIYEPWHWRYRVR
ncbi:MAG: D-alanyl-D-alanine carboxypeptidase family protein [Methylobacter sp.]|nr:D-alanyl-D-alanine carboxypeptidase family protein [Methylobacter sp.]